MLVRFTQIDYGREMALIAVANQSGQEIEVGVARYVTNPDNTSCEFAIVIANNWHHKGLGVELMNHLMDIARDRGLNTMEGEVLTSNTEMLSLAKWLGFEMRLNGEDPQLTNVVKGL
jgi:acetyltransferase